MTYGIDLKIERTRARVKAVTLARELKVSRQRISAIEALDVVPEDAAARYRAALMSVTSSGESPAAA